MPNDVNELCNLHNENYRKCKSIFILHWTNPAMQGLAWPQHNFLLWRHQMETFSALLAICAGNSPASGEFPAQRPVTRSFDIFFDLRLNKWLSTQSWGWWFETLSCLLWRQCNWFPNYGAPLQIMSISSLNIHSVSGCRICQKKYWKDRLIKRLSRP